MALVLPEKGLSETEKSRGNWPGWRGYWRGGIPRRELRVCRVLCAEELDVIPGVRKVGR